MLSERIFKDLDCRDWNELFERIAKSADDVFPRLFPTVAKVGDGGDPVACELLQHAAASLSDLAFNVAKKLQLARAKNFRWRKLAACTAAAKCWTPSSMPGWLRSSRTPRWFPWLSRRRSRPPAWRLRQPPGLTASRKLSTRCSAARPLVTAAPRIFPRSFRA
jgi:hypothetical protein